MSSSKICIRYFAVALLLALYSNVQQVSAIRCYACNSDTQPECISSANQAKFIVECASYVTKSNSSLFAGFNNHDETDAVVNYDQYDCATARGISTKDGRTIVERGCAVKPVTCETYKIVYAVGDNKGNGLQVDRCLRCNVDLCNSF